MENELKKNTYIWHAISPEGEREYGQIEAPSLTVAKAVLSSDGYTVQSIKKKTETLFGIGKKRIKSVDVTVFARNLATMLKAGISIVQALENLGANHENEAMRETILLVKNDVQNGASFSQALMKHSEHFDELFCNLIEAGEHTGSLDIMLERLASYQEKTHSLRAKVKKAMIYPITVLLVALAITIGMLVFVVPQFEGMFKSFGADLPIFTQLILTFSTFVREYIFYIILAVGAAIYGFLRWKKSSAEAALKVDQLKLRLTVFGPLLKKAIVARFARTLGTILSSGAPITDALEAVSKIAGNHAYRNAILAIREDVMTGKRMNLAMNKTDLFPSMAIQMITVGEESGSLEEMLDKIASFYEEEVDNTINSLNSLLEPFILLILGVIVGVFVTAMYLPIFKMGSVV